MPIASIVWFKRDLRVTDHEPLSLAAQQGPIIALYIVEPDLWRQSDTSYRQYQYLVDSIRSLDENLKDLGAHLVIRVGDAVEVLDALVQRWGVTHVFSHQETGNYWTYDRDRRVQRWAKTRGVVWQESTQTGVVRCLQDRDGWAARWKATMQAPLVPGPVQIQSMPVDPEAMPSAEALGLVQDGYMAIQVGGSAMATEALSTFLATRGQPYTRAMSSPVTAYTHCSRLSSYLTLGAISMRTVFQATQARQVAIKQHGLGGGWGSAMRSFSGRLRWHCHFMQKLEDEPRIEFENMHSAYNGLREDAFNDAYFDAWKVGKTGFPMVDACMRALIATGWLNFRMRAMLMSVASYHLWLHWREPAVYLARLFVDYEPGIHYSQVQMQSGTTGINSVRIYNPIKQGLDHDPDGLFIREWVPELAQCPTEYIHTPWQHGYYMAPIVDEAQARQFAAAQVYGLRKQAAHRAESQAIVKQHGSRKRPRKRPPNPSHPDQLRLPM